MSNEQGAASFQKALYSKLTEIQQAMGSLKKDKENPFYRSQYADLAQVREVINGGMKTANKFVYIQQNPITDYELGQPITVYPKNGQPYPATVPLVTVRTLIIDAESGEFITHDFSAYPKDETIQGIAGAVTYLSRYSLMFLFGLSPEDDDGNSGSGRRDDNKPAQTNGNGSGRQASTPPAKTPQAAGVDAERTSKGLGTPAEIKSLADKLKEHKVDVSVWKAYLQKNYKKAVASELSSKEIGEILKTLAVAPKIITEFGKTEEAPTPRQPGEEG